MNTHKIHTNINEYKKKHYLKLGINHLLILDALMIDGSKKKYLDSHNKTKYSEHFGMIDFNKTGIENIIISGKTNRSDKDDDEILLPGDVPNSIDYEYMFHTHPPTPCPGGRAKDGILYEFPSISDLYHFADHFNKGKVIGSIVIASEGFYLIKAKNIHNRINYPESNKIFKQLTQEMNNIQNKAIQQYGSKFSLDTYYNKIINNVSYLKMYNESIKKYWGNYIKIYYKPRKKDPHSKEWIIPGLYLPIYY